MADRSGDDAGAHGRRGALLVIGGTGLVALAAVCFPGLAPAALADDDDDRSRRRPARGRGRTRRRRGGDDRNED